MTTFCGPHPHSAATDQTISTLFKLIPLADAFIHNSLQKRKKSKLSKIEQYM